MRIETGGLMIMNKNNKQKISFGDTNDDKNTEKKHFINSLGKGDLETISKNDEKKTKKQVIIPLIRKNWQPSHVQEILGKMNGEMISKDNNSNNSDNSNNNSEKSQDKSNTNGDEVTKMAVHALVEESRSKNEIRDKMNSMSDNAVGNMNARAIPLLEENRIPGLMSHHTEDQKFKIDLALRPKVPDIHCYDEIPIDDFGVGLLMGMGWKPGDGIGLTNKRVVEPIEYIGRSEKLGLGANEAKVNLKKKQKKIY